MKNAKDMMRNIMQVYYKHNDQFLDRPYYRYVGMEEYKSLLSSKKMYFTNPIDWKLSDTGDDTENYFEDWMLQENSIREAYKLILKNNKIKFGEYYTYEMGMIRYCNFLAAASMLQQNTYCLCIANTYNDKKMIEEYHQKYGRNNIIKYKNNFFKNISVLNDGKCVLRNVNYLYADVMPMIYVSDFSDFITKMIVTSDNIEKLAKNIFDYGAFLKKSSYSYEHETRIKLRMYLNDNTSLRSLASDYYYSMLGICTEDDIVNMSMELLHRESVRLNSVYKEIEDKFVKIGNKNCFELILDNRLDFNNVVDLIMLHNCASDEEKTIVYKLAEQNGLKVCEQNFDLMY